MQTLFSYDFNLYRIRYGSGRYTCLLAKNPQHARDLGQVDGDEVVEVDVVTGNNT